MQNHHIVGCGIRVIERDGGAAAEVRQPAQAWAVEQQGAVTLGPKLEQMRLAAARLAIERQPAAGPVRGASEPGARFGVGGRGYEILDAEARDVGERQRKLARGEVVVTHDGIGADRGRGGCPGNA